MAAGQVSMFFEVVRTTGVYMRAPRKNNRLSFLATLAKAQKWVDQTREIIAVTEGEKDGKPCIAVMVAGPEIGPGVERSLPARLGGFDVVVIHTGVIASHLDD